MAKETLEEVPAQLLNYMQKNKIIPKKADAAQKAALKAKLTNKKTMQSNLNDNKEAPEFF